MKRNKKGFTLAELLIVVAIIAVLVAIAIPVFTGSLQKANVATNQANARAAYAAATADMLSHDIATGGSYSYNVGTGEIATVTSFAGYEAPGVVIGDWKAGDTNIGSLSTKKADTWFISITTTGAIGAISYSYKS